MSLNANVSKIAGSFGDIFHEAPEWLPDDTPHKRYLVLHNVIRQEAAQNGTLSLSLAALRSFALAAASGHHKATLAGFTAPAAVARRSHGLLDIAELDNRSEWSMHEPPFSMPVNGLQTIQPELLVVDPGGEEPTVDFVPHIRSRLDDAAPEPTGCPAPRMMIRTFYERYVDLIYPEEA